MQRLTTGPAYRSALSSRLVLPNANPFAPGNLRTGTQTCEDVFWNGFVDVLDLSTPTMLTSTNKAASAVRNMLSGVHHSRAAALTSEAE